MNEIEEMLNALIKNGKIDVKVLKDILVLASKFKCESGPSKKQYFIQEKIEEKLKDVDFPLARELASELILFMSDYYGIPDKIIDILLSNDKKFNIPY